jgi:hypothetical protein
MRIWYIKIGIVLVLHFKTIRMILIPSFYVAIFHPHLHMMFIYFIWFGNAGTCSTYDQYLTWDRLLTNKLMLQSRLQAVFSQFYAHYIELLCWYTVPLGQMLWCVWNQLLSCFHWQIQDFWERKKEVEYFVPNQEFTNMIFKLFVGKLEVGGPLPPPLNPPLVLDTLLLTADCFLYLT